MDKLTTVTIKGIDKDLWQQVKVDAVTNKLTIAKWLTQAIERKLKGIK